MPYKDMLIKEDQIRAEADAWYKKWRDALPKYGRDQKYWDHVAKIAKDFYEKYGYYGRGLMGHRLEALDMEYRQVFHVESEVFKGGQI